MAGQVEKYKSENKKGDAQGYVTGNTDSTLGLIVVHEWWGLTEGMKSFGREIAKAGNFQVLVPDMYRGELAEDKETAGHLMSHLDWQGAIQDISASAQFLKSRGCRKVGVTGFCMGGALAFASAALVPGDISAAAPFYGIPSPQLCDVTTISIPLQCHFGKYDEVAGFSSKKDYDPLRAKLESAGVKMDFYEYEAKHAFMNPENKIGSNYNEELAKLATSRLIEFMQKNLS